MVHFSLQDSTSLSGSQSNGGGWTGIPPSLSGKSFGNMALPSSKNPGTSEGERKSAKTT